MPICSWIFENTQLPQLGFSAPQSYYREIAVTAALFNYISLQLNFHSEANTCIATPILTAINAAISYFPNKKGHPQKRMTF
jgi:hypothetical protein